MAFQYRTRAPENWEARANQSGSDFESYIRDEYRTFTPATGENCVRILPPSNAWDDAPHFGLEVWVHYGVGPERGSVLCLFKMREQPCPICEERARAERAHDEDLSRELKPTKRVLAFIINRKDEGQGVLLWGMPYTVDMAIAKACRDRSTGQWYFIDKPDEGYDIYFDREGQQLATKYTGVALARRPSSVSDKIIDWVNDHPLPEVLRWRTYAEVKRLYEGAGRGEAPGEPPIRPDRRRDDDNGRREPPARPDNRRREPEPRGGFVADNPIMDRREARQPIQRPTDRPIGRPNGDLDDEVPPFDTDEKPAKAQAPSTDDDNDTPSSDSKSRAEQIRARFNPRTE